MKLIACWRVEVIEAFWQTLRNTLVFLFFNCSNLSNLHCVNLCTCTLKPALINSRRYFQRKFHLQEGRLESVHGHRRGARKKLRCDPANGP